MQEGDVLRPVQVVRHVQRPDEEARKEEQCCNIRWKGSICDGHVGRQRPHKVPQRYAGRSCEEVGDPDEHVGAGELEGVEDHEREEAACHHHDHQLLQHLPAQVCYGQVEAIGVLPEVEGPVQDDVGYVGGRSISRHDRQHEQHL